MLENKRVFWNIVYLRVVIDQIEAGGMKPRLLLELDRSTLRDFTLDNHTPSALLE